MWPESRSRAAAACHVSPSTLSAAIRDLETEEDARAVVHAVVHLAHALGLRVVAEGVETAAQRDILLNMHCDELQGYFYAKPMPADRLLAWAKGDKQDDQADFSTSILGGLS